MGTLGKRVFSDQQKIDIVNEYIYGNTAPQIGQKYSVSSNCIYSILKHRGIARRQTGSYNHKTCKQRANKYRINNQYFDTINTEEKAYFLGFLFADGCNDEKNNRVCLSLAEQDKDILNKLKESIEFSGNIIIIPKLKPTHQNRSFIRFNGPKISRALAMLGCTSRKSFTAQFPTKFIPKDMLNHFVRGYFDGDGSISIIKTKTGYRRPSMDICCSILFGIELSKIIMENVGIDLRMYKCFKTEIRRLATTNWVKSVKFLNWIYKDHTVCLLRKYKKYLELLELDRDRMGRKIIPPCIICGDKHFGRGYCAKHYYSIIRYPVAKSRRQTATP